MTFIEMLAKLAWFERADEGLRALTGTRSHRFVIRRTCGWSGQQMENMLKRYGVKVWGRAFTNDTLIFRVKRDQAGWAEYLLHQNGLPVMSSPVDPRNAGYAQRPGFQEKKSSQDQKGATTTTKTRLLDDVAAFVADLMQ